MTDENRTPTEIADRYVEILNGQLLDELQDVLSDDFTSHLRIGDVAGPERFKQLMVLFYEAFPDVRWYIDDTIIEGDRVVLRYHFEGVQRAAFLGIPPSHKMVRADGLELLHVRAGRIVEVWNYSDLMGLAAQLQATDPLTLAM